MKIRGGKMSVIARRPLVRWAVPTAALAVALGGGVAVNALRASADTTLPPRTPAQLLADIQSARLDAGSGTVVESADLGLPSLPGVTGGNGSGSSDLTSLVTGSHTLRVWYAGQDKVRVALLGAAAESDVIRNGTDVWIWSSKQNEATHRVLPADKAPTPLPSSAPSTPQQAADEVLKALDPTTTVSTADTLKVAGRSAYDLVLRPKDTSTLIGSVHIAIDGEKHVPLQVQVFPKGSDAAAFSIGFRSVSFDKPDDGLFAFTPPKGVKVTEDTSKPDTSGQAAPKAVTVGTGWTSVLVAKGALPGVDAKPDAQGSPQAQALLNSLPKVSGSWGSGRVLTGKLFSALLTDDGRILVGAVSQDRLTQAAADPAAALK
jgi:outer membrane lipoprotein-sorting protein